MKKSRKFVPLDEVKIGDVITYKNAECFRYHTTIYTMIVTEIDIDSSFISIFGYHLKGKMKDKYDYVNTHCYVREILSRNNDVTKYDSYDNDWCRNYRKYLKI